MPRLAILFLIIFIGPSSPGFSQSQSPYARKIGADVGLLLGGGLSYGLGKWLHHRTQGLSDAEIAAANIESIRPKFDRRATRNWSPRAGKTSDILLKSALVAPGLLLISKKVRQNDLLLTGAMAVETYLIVVGTTELTKNLARRKRPYTYNASAPLSQKTDPDARRSFFSGHTSMSTAGCFFAAKVFSDFYPDSKWRPLVWAGAATLPAAVGLHRVLAGKHFPTDVVTGYAIGGLAAWLVPQIHKKPGQPDEKLGFAPAFLIGNATMLACTLTF